MKTGMSAYFHRDPHSLVLFGVASVKRQKSKKAKVRGSPKKKSLGDRYAELLGLRRAVLKALSEKERTQSDRRRSN
jgi:hypothetical protein